MTDKMAQRWQYPKHKRMLNFQNPKQVGTQEGKNTLEPQAKDMGRFSDEIMTRN